MNKKRLKIVDYKVIMLRDYYRIVYDIDMIIQMCKNGLKDKNNFLSYQGIVITYRKCFDKQSKSRKKSLTDKHLEGLTKDQIILHEHILNLGNQYVAHMDSEEYDEVFFNLILDENNKAINIEVNHHLIEPLGRYEDLLNILIIIRKNLFQSINDCTKVVLKEYNKSTLQV